MMLEICWPAVHLAAWEVGQLPWEFCLDVLVPFLGGFRRGVERP